MAKPRAAATSREVETHNNVVPPPPQAAPHFWEEGRGHLCGLGLTDYRAGQLLGMLLKRVGEESAIELVRIAAERGVVEPFSWLQKASANRLREQGDVLAAGRRSMNFLAMRVFLDMGGDDALLGGGIPYSKDGLRKALPELLASHFPGSTLAPGWADHVIALVETLFRERMGISDPWSPDESYAGWAAWSSDPVRAFVALRAAS